MPTVDSEGALWRERAQIAVETAYADDAGGTATRVAYFDQLTVDRGPRREAKPFAQGTRVRTRAATALPHVGTVSMRQDISPSENIEALLIGVQGGVTPTIPLGATLARLWEFALGESLDSLALQYLDGATAWHVAGVVANELVIEGSGGGDNKLTANCFLGSSTPDAMTEALDERTPDYQRGWAASLYMVDAAGDLDAASAIAGRLLNWRVTLPNNLGRKWWVKGTNAVSGMKLGESQPVMALTFEAAASGVDTELGYLEDATRRQVRLRFDAGTIIEGSTTERMDIDLVGFYTAVNIGGTDGPTRTYEFTLMAEESVEAGYAARVSVLTSRATAWV